jgi:hypothetical protein
MVPVGLIRFAQFFMSPTFCINLLFVMPEQFSWKEAHGLLFYMAGILVMFSSNTLVTVW